MSFYSQTGSGSYFFTESKSATEKALLIGLRPAAGIVVWRPARLTAWPVSTRVAFSAHSCKLEDDPELVTSGSSSTGGFLRLQEPGDGGRPNPPLRLTLGER